MPNCISLCSLIIMRASAAIVVVVDVAVVGDLFLSLVYCVSLFMCAFPPLQYACTNDREMVRVTFTIRALRLPKQRSRQSIVVALCLARRCSSLCSGEVVARSWLGPSPAYPHVACSSPEPLRVGNRCFLWALAVSLQMRQQR
jgi:hypothetical protein